jgi:hypothetical protein
LSSPPASLQEVRGFQKRDVILTICSSTSSEGVQAGAIMFTSCSTTSAGGYRDVETPPNVN